MKNKQKLLASRRKFMGVSLLSAAGLSTLPQWSMAVGNKFMSNPDDNHQARLGFIGLGRQAGGLINGLSRIPGVEVLAGSDVYGLKRTRFEKQVADLRKELGKESISVQTYENYKDLLQRPDIDAVVIASPDHWHALMAIDACKANKDVYLEKPLTLTVKEGQELVKAVRANGIVLAVGSQQRSDLNFQHAVRMVQKGKIGKVKQILVHVGQPESPKPFDLPAEQVPESLNWEKWLGPLKHLPFNNQLAPPISLNPPKNEGFWGGWRWYKETGGGYMTDWGAHMFDIAQWGLGMDRSGPVEVRPNKDGRPLTFLYANGTEMVVGPFDGGTQGVKFIGEEGWIQVSRGNFKSSDKSLKPESKSEKLPYSPHLLDFYEAIQKRRDPQVPVEVGHSTCVVCTIGNIANELQRTLRWDPANQEFPGDEEANAKLHYDYENGYSLNAI
ncbi:Gfo/Idh/MocA family protein [Pararhodonellum marinum]|uniref:Gfo/Idh/MocA family protein n=1 Tax=Pararhodonellum marinum TaxID=2755358 RepID=UPI00188E195F|nr:Gfo/Idh/MocA family oxidoreductase [Pararhodonellum marinum]